MAGYGVYTFANGRRYEGQWDQGELNGYARKYDVRGNLTEQGFYVNGELN